MKVICRSDCRGLCPHCGANLNNEECRCEKHGSDPTACPAGPSEAGLVQKAIKRYTIRFAFCGPFKSYGTVHEELECLIRSDVIQSGARVLAAPTIIFIRLSLAECPNCHEKKLPHRACPRCGYYKGREVIDTDGQDGLIFPRFASSRAAVPDDYHCPGCHGGRPCPSAEVEGAILAARELDVRVLLVGMEGRFAKSLNGINARSFPSKWCNADRSHHHERFASHAFRRKKDSSLHVAAKLVRDGKPKRSVSAGNTGAVMTVARFVIGTLPSVDRPGSCLRVSEYEGESLHRPGCRRQRRFEARHLEQFAVMGEIYYRAIWGVKKPRVALLSIGEEESKGNELTRDAANRLKQTSLNFVGNVEGRDVFRGNVDVIVCDGFIGNIVLKLSEGLVEHIGGMLKKAIKSSLDLPAGLCSLQTRI